MDYDLYLRDDKFAKISIDRRLSDLEILSLKALFDATIVPASPENITQKIPLLSRKVLLRPEKPLG